MLMNNAIPYKIVIPQNIVDYLESHNDVALDISFNHVDVLNGYGDFYLEVTSIKRVAQTCYRCGYDTLWNPDDSESQCTRHTLSNERYDDVFVWTPYKCDLCLKDAFDIWLSKQPSKKEYYKPAVKMTFGQLHR